MAPVGSVHWAKGLTMGQIVAANLVEEAVVISPPVSRRHWGVAADKLFKRTETYSVSRTSKHLEDRQFLVILIVWSLTVYYFDFPLLHDQNNQRYNILIIIEHCRIQKYKTIGCRENIVRMGKTLSLSHDKRIYDL